jgi:hypothetical protein
MTKLTRYEDFIERVNELGFMAFSNTLPGFPSLTEETPGNIWHTGNTDTDPWRWKDRAAEEKRLAFGCILGGNKGFIAPRMYSLFYVACRPEEHMEELQAYGLISPAVWQLWQLFESRSFLSTGEIRQEMGVTKKKGGSKADKAVSELERMFHITVAGNRRKTDKFGQPFGWAANVYDKVENWVPKEWFKMNPARSSEEAKNIILEHGLSISKNVSREQLAEMLKF